MKEKIEIYVAENCKNCEEIIKQIEKENIKFEKKSIEKFKKDWNNIVNIVHMNSTPIIWFKDTYFVPERDFNYPNQVIDILKNYERPNVNDMIVLSETIKTLNFNILNMVNSIYNIVKEINKKLRI
jgi:thiol-disulfide isomerase/thioredoxin|tara:strand:+ start:694 stop:1071 length:378 start_codon:yes stop_codon:yes gene_type:complete